MRDLGESVSLSERLRCPHCNTKLTSSEAYAIHIMTKMDLPCRVCHEYVTFESINVSTFRKDFDSLRYGLLYDSDLKMYQLPMTPTWKVRILSMKLACL